MGSALLVVTGGCDAQKNGWVALDAGIGWLAGWLLAGF